MSFASLLIHTCDIQAKTLNRTGYEKVEEWADVATDVPCRHDYERTLKISDTNMRLNTDDDVFFFGADVEIERGNRIVHDGTTYEVVKVAKMYGGAALHHLEVIARATDHK